MDDKQLLNRLFYRLKNIKEAEGILHISELTPAGAHGGLSRAAPHAPRGRGGAERSADHRGAAPRRRQPRRGRGAPGPLAASAEPTPAPPPRTGALSHTGRSAARVPVALAPAGARLLGWCNMGCPRNAGCTALGPWVSRLCSAAALPVSCGVAAEATPLY
jgi:hypothetical protein